MTNCTCEPTPQRAQCTAARGREKQCHIACHDDVKTLSRASRSASSDSVSIAGPPHTCPSAIVAGRTQWKIRRSCFSRLSCFLPLVRDRPGIVCFLSITSRGSVFAFAAVTFAAAADLGTLAIPRFAVRMSAATAAVMTFVIAAAEFVIGTVLVAAAMPVTTMMLVMPAAGTSHSASYKIHKAASLPIRCKSHNTAHACRMQQPCATLHIPAR